MARWLIVGGDPPHSKQSLEYVDTAEIASVPEAQRTQKLNRTPKAVVHSALKRIAVFLNSDGATLLLGVHDNRSILGVGRDYTLLGRKQDRDVFENKRTDLIKTRIEPLPVGLFTVLFVEIDGKTVCRIDVQRAKAQTYLDNKLYVRFDNSTEELTGRKLQDWMG